MRFLFPLLTLPMTLLPGCTGLGGYQVGSHSLFGPDIQTVYVPFVESDPTRRHLAERLTEAICKRIEERSPYKVVARPSADSVLECRIVDKKQRVALVDSYNDPRQKSGELRKKSCKPARRLLLLELTRLFQAELSSRI